MTSFAFILGVVPLVLATGAGAEMRQTLGHCRVQRHARRDGLRHLLHAGLLCCGPSLHGAENPSRLRECDLAACPLPLKKNCLWTAIRVSHDTSPQTIH